MTPPRVHVGHVADLNLNLIPPDECANCGAPIPRHAKACPECGADERTGWRETSIYDGLDLPREDESVKPGAKAINDLPWYWWIAVALALLLGLAALVR